MTTTQRLLSEANEIWQAYDKHPFVLGIANGTLDQAKFQYYIIQDYLYLKEYAKVFAVGLAKAKTLEMMRLFSEYIHTLTDGEMDIHRGYMGRLGVTQQMLQDTPCALDNLSYTSYMLRVAYEEGEAEILCAILSCAYSYEVIAKNIVRDHPDAIHHPFYGEWVSGYASEGYAQANVVLLDTLNRLTVHYTDEQIWHLVDIFVACSRYELAFWQMAWDMRG